MPEIQAVLTGDLIESSRLSDEQFDQARDSVKAAADGIRRWERGLVRGSPDFFRGDAWQMLVTAPGWALRAAVYVRASLISQGVTDTRIAVALGAVDRVDARRISRSTGEAFRLSGEALDSLPRSTRMTVVLPEERGALAIWMPAVARLCDALISGWTRRQAEIIREALSPAEPTQEELADHFEEGISQQAVAKALTGGQWPAVQAAVGAFERTDWPAG